MRGQEIDLLYLDSMDVVWHDPLPSAIHHHAELMAAMPLIGPRTLVVVDDAPTTIDGGQVVEIGGKGFLVARHMLLCGAELAFSSYQAGWTRVGPVRTVAETDLQAMVERARAKVEANDLMSSEQLYKLILGLTMPPRTEQARVARGEACAFYARLALARHRLGAAADWLEEALSANPRATDYRLDLITKCFLPVGNLKGALLEAEQATRIAPDYPLAWHVLGGVRQALGDAEGCLAAYDRQLELVPEDPNALLDRTMIALHTADYDAVRRLCDKIPEGNPRKADAVHCMAMVAYREHRHEDAIVHYQNAIALGCRDAPTAHWNMSLAMLSIGDYARGWAEQEWRAEARNNPALSLSTNRFALPLWKGEAPTIYVPGDSRTELLDRQAVLHVHDEAGSDDNLCLVRFLPMLASMGFKVRYECAPEMVDLIRYSMPMVEVVPKAADYPGELGIEPFDYHIPICSIPAVLGVEVSTVPNSVPYLRADPEFVRELATRRGDAFGDTSMAGGLRVGFCWSSSIREGIWMREFDTRKSMQFDAILALIRVVSEIGGSSFSLQVGPERNQHGGRILDYLPRRPSWAETAALIECLDAVVTVDAAVAHLAGAMGKRVLLMCQRDGCAWHFMCWRPGARWNEASPWYPTMKVFRQRDFDHPHRWHDVIADVADELRSMPQARAPSAGS
jgi:tetratricopeptide (TPR) repeat protein